MSEQKVGYGDEVVDPDQAKRWQAKCLCRSLTSHITIVNLLRQLVGGLSPETQLWFTNECIHDPLYSLFPKNWHFERRLLKAVIQASEEDGFSIHDDLMADFSATLTVPQEFPSLQAGNRSSDRKSVSSLCYKLYAYCRHGPYEKPPWVQLEGCERNSLSHVLESDEGQLQESSNALTFIHGTPTEGLIAVSVSRDILAGDTGCHEWEAGFFLSEYVLNNPDIFKDASVLELGCGIGLVGIALSRVKPLRIVCTDGNEDTVVNCKYNFKLNRVQCGGQVSVQKFAWEENMSELFNATRCTSVDIVVGSDLLYDPTSFPSLVKLLVQLLTVGGAHTAYLACTQRNEKTLAMFDELLEVQEGITVVRTSLYSTDLKVNSSIRFCHIPSLEAARHRIILYKISFTRNNSS